MIIKKLKKYLLIFLSTSVLTYLSLDLLISYHLYNNAKTEEDKFYLENYPVAIKNALYSKKIILDKMNPLLVEKSYNSALLGYFQPNYISIIKNGVKLYNIEQTKEFRDALIEHKKKGGKILIALGDSATGTAQMSNWPNPLEKLISENNFIVINAGHNGFTSYQENILLFKIILPIINPILPDIVISLTGLNDISRGFSSILNIQRFKFDKIYKETYIHGEFLTKDILNNQNYKYSNYIKNQIAYSQSIRKLFPSLSQFFISSQKSYNNPKSLYQSYGSIDGENILRYCNLIVRADGKIPGFYPHKLKTIIESSVKGVKIFKNFSDAIFVNNEIEFSTAKKDILECSRKRDKVFIEDKKIYNHSSKDEILIVNELLQNHFRTERSLSGMNISYYAFLRPISYKKHSQIKDIVNSNYKLIHWNMQNQIRGHDFRVKIDKIYDKVKNEIQKKPFNYYFFSLDHIFDNYKSDPYTDDNIHFTETASKIISQNIYEKVLRSFKSKKLNNFLINNQN